MFLLLVSLDTDKTLYAGERKLQENSIFLIFAERTSTIRQTLVGATDWESLLEVTEAHTDDGMPGQQRSSLIRQVVEIKHIWKT